MNPSPALVPSVPSAHAQPCLRQARDARGVHTLTLNAPQQFNVLSEAMLGALEAALVKVAQDPGARVVVIAAEGKAFCAGHDLKEMKAQPKLAYYQALFARCARLMVQLQNLSVPVVARVQGLATAAGCQLVAQCDLALASDVARFGVNGIDVGLFCATPSVPLVRNMGRKQAMHMLMTGDFIDAAEACRRGLVNQVLAPEALDGALEALLQRLLAKPAPALAMGKALFYRQVETGVEAAYQLAVQSMACNMVLDVAQDGVQAFVDKRKPGAQL